MMMPPIATFKTSGVVFQKYRVGMDPNWGKDWDCEVTAPSWYEAAVKAAEQAHAEWAWEVTWPLKFIVTDEGGRSRVAEVDREMDPRFVVVEMKEIGN